jgi:hypothetical protein
MVLAVALFLAADPAPYRRGLLHLVPAAGRRRGARFWMRSGAASGTGLSANQLPCCALVQSRRRACWFLAFRWRSHSAS